LVVLFQIILAVAICTVLEHLLMEIFENQDINVLNKNANYYNNHVTLKTIDVAMDLNVKVMPTLVVYLVNLLVNLAIRNRIVVLEYVRLRQILA